MTDSIEEFLETIDRVYGAYLDAITGFEIFRARIVELQARTTATPGTSKAEQDSMSFFYGRGDPNDPTAVVQHRVTQGQLKYRNRKNGENSLFLGSMGVVAIYQYWESRFRSEIATELKLEREDLKNDLLGDLKNIRNAIIHCSGVSDKKVEKCIVLKWFAEGDAIEIGEDRMYEIVGRLRSACVAWISQRESS